MRGITLWTPENAGITHYISANRDVPYMGKVYENMIAYDYGTSLEM